MDSDHLGQWEWKMNKRFDISMVYLNYLLHEVLSAWKGNKMSNDYFGTMTYTCCLSSSTVSRNIQYVCMRLYLSERKINEKIMLLLSLIHFVFTLITTLERFALVLYCSFLVPCGYLAESKFLLWVMVSINWWSYIQLYVRENW